MLCLCLQIKYLLLQMSLPRADTLQGNLYYVFNPQPNNKAYPPVPYPFQWRQFMILVRQASMPPF